MRSLTWAVAFALAVPTFTSAQEPVAETRSYAALRLGAIVPKHDDMEGFDTGFALEGAVGYRATENVALELGIGRFSTSASGTALISGVVANVTETVVAYPILLTVKAIAPLDRLQLFALAGGGVYVMSAEAEATAPGYYPLTATDSDSPFAFHVGGGVNIQVSPRAQLGVEVKYILGTTKMWDSSNHFDSVMIAGGLTFGL